MKISPNYRRLVLCVSFQNSTLLRGPMYYERTQSDGVGSLLGDLQMVAKGETAGPAAWYDWHKALEVVLSKK